MSRSKTLHVTAAGVLALIAAAGLAACTEVLGVNDLALGECQSGQARCGGSAQPQTCDETRHWQPAAACVHQTCVDGACQGQCLAAERRCADSTKPQHCDEKGQSWVDEKECAYVCLDGSCTGECVPGDAGCMDNKTRLCDKNGKWQDQKDCGAENKTCVAAVCTGVCQPGARRCTGYTPQRCEGGDWKSDPACDTSTEVCEGGICKIACVPGDLRCDPAVGTPQTCGDDKLWHDKGAACDVCKGCNETTGECNTLTLPDGAPCPVPDGDKCAFTAACQGGACTVATAVQCVSANVCSPACDKPTGSCAAADGAACDDGDACTAQSACASGACDPAGDHAWAHWGLESPPPPAQRYTIVVYDEAHEGDEVVFDTLTRLLWQRKANPLLLVSWDEANTLCADLTIAGYPKGSFRLPTRTELASLVDYSKSSDPALHDPMIDTLAFPWNSDQNNLDYWTSSSVAFDPTQAWEVSFGGGFVTNFSKDMVLNVRCVH